LRGSSSSDDRKGRSDENPWHGGPPDLADEEKVWNNPDDKLLKARLIKQAAAWDGKHGAMLHAVDPADGKTLAEYKLDSLPVFDGMISAGGRLLVALTDGTVVCMGPGKPDRLADLKLFKPTALKQEPAANRPPIIKVIADGQYVLHGKAVTLNELPAALAVVAKGKDDPRVIIQAGPKIEFEIVQRLLKALAAAGVGRITITASVEK
jgi:hypothetical protein